MSETELIKLDRDERGVILNSEAALLSFAQTVLNSGMVPASYLYGSGDTIAKIAVALQTGAEIGMSPMFSLQNIYVLKGRPCLWGQALPALVWGSGKCAEVEEWSEVVETKGEPADLTYFCRSTRITNGRLQEHPCVSQFSVGDAKRAGLWEKRGKNGAATPWITHPKRMLQMRARAFNFRDNFADVLGGIGVVEEVRDYVDIDQRPANATQALDLAAIGHEPTPGPHLTNEHEVDVVDPDDYGGNVPPADVEPMPSELPFEARS